MESEELLISESQIGYNYNFSVSKSDTGSYVMLYSKGSYHHLYSAVVEISGNSISMGTETQLSSTSNSAQYVRSCSLSTNSILIRYCDSNYRLIGAVLTVSGTTISIGTETQLDTSTYVYHSTFLKISSTKILMSYMNYSYIKGIILDISGSTITIGTSFNIVEMSTSTKYNSTNFENGKAAIIFQGDSQGAVNVAFLTENSGSVSLLKNVKVTNVNNVYQGGKGIFYNNNCLLVESHYSSVYPYEVFMNVYLDDNSNVYQTQRISLSSSRIDGLLISEATTSTVGDVYILDV